jgi:hypothetical protein
LPVRPLTAPGIWPTSYKSTSSLLSAAGSRGRRDGLQPTLC